VPLDDDLAGDCNLGVVKTAQQRRWSVTGFGMKVVAGAIKIGRRRRYEIASVSATVELTKLEAYNLRGRIGFVVASKGPVSNASSGIGWGSFTGIDTR
jgi:hypothetical protein